MRRRRPANAGSHPDLGPGAVDGSSAAVDSAVVGAVGSAVDGGSSAVDAPVHHNFDRRVLRLVQLPDQVLVVGEPDALGGLDGAGGGGGGRRGGVAVDADAGNGPGKRQRKK